jgi:hypothetical protein
MEANKCGSPLVWGSKHTDHHSCSMRFEHSTRRASPVPLFCSPGRPRCELHEPEPLVAAVLSHACLHVHLLPPGRSLHLPLHAHVARRVCERWLQPRGVQGRCGTGNVVRAACIHTAFLPMVRQRELAEMSLPMACDHVSVDDREIGSKTIFKTCVPAGWTPCLLLTRMTVGIDSLCKATCASDITLAKVHVARVCHCGLIV